LDEHTQTIRVGAITLCLCARRQTVCAGRINPPHQKPKTTFLFFFDVDEIRSQT
jgi:hypothetical protein